MRFVPSCAYAVSVRFGLAVVAASLLISGAACGAGREAEPVETPPAGSSAQTITVDGVGRTFRLYRPESLRGDRPAPLVVMLHGGLGSASQAEETYGWNAVAEREGFVVAYPDGLNRAWAVGAGCCGRPGRNGVDDVAFLTALVEWVAGRMPIDATRVYATGMSNGAMMSYRLACDTTVFAAIGPVGGTLLGTCEAPAPISVIHIHGTADRSIKLEGGPGKGPAEIDGPSVASVLESWRAVNDCATPTEVVSGLVTITTATCPAGRDVQLITIEGAGHQWPGAPPRPAVQRALGMDPPSTALDATTEIWRFFAAHPRTAAN